MTPFRKEKIERILQEISSRFIEIESGPQSLITVVAVNFDESSNKADILISVLPDDKSDIVMEFLGRKKRDFIDYMKKNSRFKNIPFVEFRLAKQ